MDSLIRYLCDVKPFFRVTFYTMSTEAEDAREIPEKKRAVPDILKKHYTIPDTANVNGTFQALCKYCSKNIKGSFRSSTNFKTHIQVSTFSILSFISI